jgi:hypothetical protein
MATMGMEDEGRFDGMTVTELRIDEQAKSTNYPRLREEQNDLSPNQRDFVGFAYYLVMASLAGYWGVFLALFFVPREIILELAETIGKALALTRTLDFNTRRQIGDKVREIVCSLLWVDHSALSKMGLDRYLGKTLGQIACMLPSPSGRQDFASWVLDPTIGIDDRYISYVLSRRIDVKERFLNGLVAFARHIVGVLKNQSTFVGERPDIDITTLFCDEVQQIIVHACVARQQPSHQGKEDATFTLEACQDILLRLRKKLGQIGIKSIWCGESEEGGFPVHRPFNG